MANENRELLEKQIEELREIYAQSMLIGGKLNTVFSKVLELAEEKYSSGNYEPMSPAQMSACELQRKINKRQEQLKENMGEPEKTNNTVLQEQVDMLRNVLNEAESLNVPKNLFSKKMLEIAEDLLRYGSLEQLTEMQMEAYTLQALLNERKKMENKEVVNS